MHYASLVAIMNFLADAINPEVYFLIPSILNPERKATIQYDSDMKQWIVKQFNGINTEIFNSALDVVGFLFKENFSLLHFRNELEEASYIEALYCVKRYQTIRNILGKEKLEAELIEIERNIQKIKPTFPPKLELIKNED